jgi:hypothetical protein
MSFKGIMGASKGDGGSGRAAIWITNYVGLKLAGAFVGWGYSAGVKLLGGVVI